MKVDANVTEWSVSVLPEDNVNHHTYVITVAYRGRGRWAILHHGFCLGRDGEWDYEVQPSSREDEWLDAHRFARDEALAIAVREAPNVVVNGRTAASLLGEDA